MEYIEDDDIIVVASTYVLLNLLKYKKPKKRRHPYIRINPYLKKRKTNGRFSTDFIDMLDNPTIFKENFHMGINSFNILLELIEKDIENKRDNWGDLTITPKEKLAIVLEFFACGDLQRHIASCYRISKQYFGKILDKVCDAICLKLSNKIPTLDRANFKNIAEAYKRKWNFPNCIGAIDGKHIAIQAPKNSGSLFYNYKGYFSIVLLAACDANYKFIYLDIGAFGSEGDSNIFTQSKFGKNILNDKEDYPEDAPISGINFPYFYVADDAFPLSKRIMKPYSKRKLTKEEIIFNYRLSRARRCIENAFGILCTKMQVIKRTMFCTPNRAKKIVTACTLLHNFLIQCDEVYCPKNYGDTINERGEIVEGEWRQNTNNNFPTSLSFRNSGRSMDQYNAMRDFLKDYVNSPIGSVPWQERATYTF